MTRDEETMDDALERARGTGGADVFHVLTEENGDDTPGGAPPEGPQDATTASDGPDDDFLPYPAPAAPPGAPPAPAAPAADPMKSARLDALKAIQRLAASGPPKPPPGLDDEAISAARKRDSEQNRWDRVSAALAAAGRRQAPQLPARPGEAQGLLEQRQAFDASAARQRGSELTLNERLLAALKDGNSTTPALTPFQQWQVQRAEAEDRRKAEEDAAKKKAAATQLEQDRALLQKDFPDYDLSQADEATIAKLLSLRHAKATEAGAAATRDLAGAKFNYDKAEDADKKARAAAQDIPPGFEVAPNANPSPESRKKFTALVASQQKMRELTQAMRQELQGVSALDRMLPGEKRRRLQQLATQMRIEAKNVAELGALSGPDMGLMEAMATDPTALGSLAGGSLEANLDGLDSWGDASVRAGGRAFGIQKAGSTGTGGKVRVRRKADGQTGSIPAENFDPQKYERLDG